MEDNKLLSKSFLWMCIGLLVTFVTGYGVSMNERMLENIFAGSAFWILLVLELILVIVLSARVMKMSPTAAKICFILYRTADNRMCNCICAVCNHHDSYDDYWNFRNKYTYITGTSLVGNVFPYKPHIFTDNCISRII